MTDYFTEAGLPPVQTASTGDQPVSTEPKTEIPAPPPSFVNLAPPETPATPVVQTSDFKGLPVRTSGDRIFLLLKGKKYWVANPEAYSKLGFKFGDERKIDIESLDLFQEGEPLK